MRILPNPAKEARNRAKHGWSFERVGEVFLGPVFHEPDDRPLGYEAEARVRLTGRIGMRVVRLVIEPISLPDGDRSEADFPSRCDARGRAGVLEPVSMSEDADQSLPPRRTDEEIAAAVAEDPDAAPILRRAAFDRLIAQENDRDKHGVARLRRRLGLAQVQFASRYRLPLSTLRQWEQGVREPDAASKLLLAVISEEPELVARVARRAA